MAALTALAWLVLILPGLRGFFKDSYQPYLFGGDYQWLEPLFLLLVFVVTFTLYFKCVRADLRTIKPVVVLAWTAVFTLLLVFLYPFACQDVYYYIATGKLQSFYRSNPYITTAHQIAGWRMDPFLSNTDWGFLTHVYGPVWAKITAWVVWLSGNNLFLAIILFKLWAGIIHLINVILVGLAAQKNHLSSGPAMLIYGWNPLLLFELPGHAHNDALVLTFITLALLLLSYQGGILSIPSLTMAILTKYVPAILLPFFIVWYLLNNRLRTLLVGGLISLILALLWFSPYWAGWQIFNGLIKQMNFYSIKSLHTVISQGLYQLLPQLPQRLVFEATSLVLTMVFVVVYGYILGRYWLKAKPSNNLLIICSMVVTIIYLFIANKWFQPWYLAWVMPLVAVSKLPNSLAYVGLFLTFSAELSRLPQLIAGSISLSVQLGTFIIAWLPLLIYHLKQNKLLPIFL